MFMYILTMKLFTNQVCCSRTSNFCLKVQAGKLTFVQMPQGQAPGITRQVSPTASHGSPSSTPGPSNHYPLQTCSVVASVVAAHIMATNLGPGPCPATWGPCGIPDSPQANCSAPTSPTAMPVGTCPHIHMLPPSISLPLTHMILCPIKPVTKHSIKINY